MGFLQRIFGRNESSTEYKERLEAAQEARLRYFETLVNGITTPFPAIGNRRTFAELAGGHPGPKWPHQSAWRRLSTGHSTILVSDGLSDPFPKDKPTQSGYGLEVLMETTDEIGADYESSWLFHLLFQVSQNVAHHGGFRRLIEQHQVGMLEVRSTSELSAMQNEAGNVGIFLGLHNGTKHDTIDYGRSEALIVTAKLLTASELEYAATNEAIGYRFLRERFLTEGDGHMSNLSRTSVI